MLTVKMHIRYFDQIMNRISFETKGFINQSSFFGQVSNNQHNTPNMRQTQAQMQTQVSESEASEACSASKVLTFTCAATLSQKFTLHTPSRVYFLVYAELSDKLTNNKVTGTSGGQQEIITNV